jgi:hypothetical protein
MVAISLFPVSAREHQAGLPLAAFVFEIYDHDGMTRNLVGFYGDYVHELAEILNNRLAEAQPGFSIGPIRSGRLAFEDIKMLYPGAVLITAGASADRPSERLGSTPRHQQRHLIYQLQGPSRVR